MTRCFPGPTKPCTPQTAPIGLFDSLSPSSSSPPPSYSSVESPANPPLIFVAFHVRFCLIAANVVFRWNAVMGQGDWSLGKRALGRNSCFWSKWGWCLSFFEEMIESVTKTVPESKDWDFYKTFLGLRCRCLKNYAGCEEGVRGYRQAEGQLHHCTRNLQNFLGAKVGGIGFSGIGNFPWDWDFWFYIRFFDFFDFFFSHIIAFEISSSH